MRGLVAATLAVCGAASGALLTPAASAQIESIRLGVMEHNICVTDCKNADKETGVNINGEIRFASPGFLEFIWSPRPYVMASVNTDGNTSFGGFGLQYDFPLGEAWRFEGGLGYVIHDGTANNPFPSGTQQAVDYSATHVLLGSEDLFRTSLGLTWKFSDAWGVQVLYEHLSHGQILGTGRNQGLDEIGVRAVWTLQ
jgi:lipid A 3-O-deacylase